MITSPVRFYHSHSKSYRRINKTNIRDYAIKSDDVPKTNSIRYPEEGLKKTNIRGYAVKSDDDPKTNIIQYPKPML